MAFGLLRRYARWLHLDVPAGRVEPGPVVQRDGSTNLQDVVVAGDLAGVPLLKFASDTGAKAVERIDPGPADGPLDLVILGAGVSGMAAALGARDRGLRFLVLEASEPFSTIVNFPRGKPIFTYPNGMTPAGRLQMEADVKEDLVEELEAQVEGQDLPVVLGVGAESVHRVGEAWEVRLKAGAEPRPWQAAALPETFAEPVRARHVLVALGRSGEYRRLEVPGEDLPKVSNRLHDPAKFRGQRVLVVGGGDSALEAATALATSGARVTLSYRGKAFFRPKPENLGAVAAAPVEVAFESHVEEIREKDVALRVGQETRTIPNDALFVLIGRDPPLAFFRRSGIGLLGEMTRRRWFALGAFVLLCLLLYVWKFGWISSGLDWVTSLDATHVLGTLARSAREPAFAYALAYSLLVTIFGLRRMRRRRTPYVRAQTWTLIAIQVIPLFLLPQILLPWMGANGWVPGWIESTFFPGASWWRAYGLILAWPLFFWNLVTAEPIVGWLVLSFLQTFVIIPWLVWRWGKGAYCGWICSCGALAETLGDTHRQKMWHGPTANRWNLAGQVVLAVAFLGLGWRVLGWVLPDGNFFASGFDSLVALPYEVVVDFFLAGVLGVGPYFWFSGRVWCRFFCPLAALMHIYAKLTRYRIFADQKKCISCNVCTSVCHQGIDVMGYANKGRPLTDVECVRCSACVQECPTGTLSFGRVGRDGRPAALDRLAASPVQAREGETPEAVLGRLRAQ